MKTVITSTRGTTATRSDLHAPTAPAKGVIVIAYGSDGMTNDLSGPWQTMIEGYAVSLAEKGYCAVIPDYLAVTGTAPGPAVFAAMLDCRSAWVAALSDACDQAVALAKVDPRRVGLLGFSLGGHLALQLRAKAKVLVEFFAPLLDGPGAPGQLVRAQIHHGEADAVPGTEFVNAARVAATLKQEGTATELFGYPGAGHGFIGADAANRNARDLSKARTLSFFETHL